MPITSKGSGFSGLKEMKDKVNMLFVPQDQGMVDYQIEKMFVDSQFKGKIEPMQMEITGNCSN